MLLKSILILIINLIPVAQINHINDLRWSNRVLVIINDGSIDFSKKINLYKKEFDERDFLIIYINGKNTFINNKKMSKQFSDSIFKKIKNINSNHFFLIGKDGQVKNSYSFRTGLEKIFYDVDRMPMRKYEMQNRIK